MKISNKEIQSQLDNLRKITNRFKAKQTELAELGAAAKKLRATITWIGEPEWTDDAGITALSSSQMKLSLIEKKIAKTENEIAAQAEGECFELCRTIGGFTQKVLQPAYDLQLETATAVLQPFFSDRAKAAGMAIRTDACQTAWAKMCAFSQIENRVRNAGGLNAKVMFESFVQIQVILTEALKDRPNLQEFIRFEPLAEEPAAPEESVPAAAGGATISTKAEKDASLDHSSADEAALAAEAGAANKTT